MPPSATREKGQPALLNRAEKDSGGPWRSALETNMQGKEHRALRPIPASQRVSATQAAPAPSRACLPHVVSHPGNRSASVPNWGLQQVTRLSLMHSEDSTNHLWL